MQNLRRGQTDSTDYGSPGVGQSQSEFDSWLNLLFGRTGNVFNNLGSAVGSAAGNTGGSFINGILKGLGVDSNFGSVLSSLLNRWAGTGLTPADYQSAELQRYLRRTSYEDEVKSMMAAGLNPAMLYDKGGSASTPSLSLPSFGMSFSEMMQLPLLQAQIDNIKADTENKLSTAGFNRQRTLTEEQETRLRTISADYGIEYTETELGRMLADIDLKYTDIGLKASQKDYIDNQSEAVRITNEYLPRKFDAELKELGTRSESESASAKASLASAAFTTVQANYARDNGFLMSQNDALLVATYIASLVGLDKTTVSDVIKQGLDGVKDKFKKKSPTSEIPKPSDFYGRKSNDHIRRYAPAFSSGVRPYRK